MKIIQGFGPMVILSWVEYRDMLRKMSKKNIIVLLKKSGKHGPGIKTYTKGMLIDLLYNDHMED